VNPSSRPRVSGSVCAIADPDAVSEILGSARRPGEPSSELRVADLAGTRRTGRRGPVGGGGDLEHFGDRLDPPSQPTGLAGPVGVDELHDRGDPRRSAASLPLRATVLFGRTSRIESSRSWLQPWPATSRSLKAAQLEGDLPLTHAGVLAQVWRGGARQASGRHVEQIHP
jgi:hypothetical protein